MAGGRGAGDNLGNDLTQANVDVLGGDAGGDHRLRHEPVDGVVLVGSDCVVGLVVDFSQATQVVVDELLAGQTGEAALSVGAV